MKNNSKKNLVCFDTAYSLAQYEAGGLEIFTEGKLLNGYFNTIFVINIASNIKSPNVIGKSTLIKLSDHIEYLDVPLGRFRFLAAFKKINFIFTILSTLIAVIRICKKNNISFIRGEDAEINGFLAMLISKIMNIPLLIGVWGNPAEIRNYTGKPMWPYLLKFIAVEVFLEKLVLKFADRVMVQNENNKNFAVNILRSDEKIRFFKVSNQIDDLHYQDPKLRDKPPDFFKEFKLVGQKKIIIISRLEEEKRVFDAIKVISYLVNKKSMQVDFFICGVGPEESFFKKYASQEGIIDNIHFCGMRNQLWLSTAIPLMDLCISPLTGRALVEVALGGIPVVGYHRDWQAEIIEHNLCGYICEFGDIEALSNFSNLVLQNHKRAREMGSELRKKALKAFNKDDALKMEQSCYDELLK